MLHEHAPTMSLITMSRLNRVILLFCFMTSCVIVIEAQDLYGAQYQFDEARPRARHMQENDNGEGGIDAESNCGGEFQWMCDNGQCIARYDRCDGFLQCEDGSDEKNCRGRFAPHEGNNPHPVKHPASTPKPKNASPTNATSIVSSTKPPTNGSILLPLKFVLAGAAAFILVAGFVHVIVKRRQSLRNNMRNYRKGQSLVDDEDDLLISQMYS